MCVLSDVHEGSQDCRNIVNNICATKSLYDMNRSSLETNFTNLSVALEKSLGQSRPSRPHVQLGGDIRHLRSNGQYLLPSMMTQTDWVCPHMWSRQALPLSHSTKDDRVIHYTSTMLIDIWTSLLFYASLLVTTLAKICMHLWYKKTFLYAEEMVFLAHSIQHCIDSLLLSLFSLWTVLSLTLLRYGLLYVAFQYTSRQIHMLGTRSRPRTGRRYCGTRQMPTLPYQYARHTDISPRMRIKYRTRKHPHKISKPCFIDTAFLQSVPTSIWQPLVWLLTQRDALDVAFALIIFGIRRLRWEYVQMPTVLVFNILQFTIGGSIHLMFVHLPYKRQQQLIIFTAITLWGRPLVTLYVLPRVRTFMALFNRTIPDGHNSTLPTEREHVQGGGPIHLPRCDPEENLWPYYVMHVQKWQDIHPTTTATHNVLNRLEFDRLTDDELLRLFQTVGLDFDNRHDLIINVLPDGQDIQNM